MTAIKLFFSKIGLNCWKFLQTYLSKKFLFISLSVNVVKCFLIFFGFLLAAAIILQVSFKKFSPPYQKLISKFIYCFYIISIIGLIFLFFNYEGIPFLGYKFWIILDIISLIGYLIYIIFYILTKIPGEVKLYKDLELKKKYLNCERR
jgi:hypothetical protein